MIKVYLRDGGIYTISKKQIEYWQYLYPDVEVIAELTLLKEMWNTGAMQRKTAKSINKFINKWLNKQSKEDFY